MAEKYTIEDGITEMLMFDGIKTDDGYLEGKYYSPYMGPFVRYEGRLTQDLVFDGFGKLFNKNGQLTYEGYWKNGHRHGYGTTFSEADGGLEHEGVYYQGIPIDHLGEHILVEDKLIPAGQLGDGCHDLYHATGNVLYEGFVLNNRYHGRGTAFYATGNIKYEGQWYEGLYDGFGTDYYEQGGKRHEGHWKDGVENGSCRHYFENGSVRFIGDFSKGRPNGQGVMFHDTGKVLYEGTFECDWWPSQGKEYYKNGVLKFEGNFFQGARYFYGKRYYVKGKLYTETGELRHEGDMLKRFPVGGSVGRSQRLD